MKQLIKKSFAILLCTLILLGILQKNMIIPFANELNNKASNDVLVSNEEIISALNKANYVDGSMDSAFILSTSNVEENAEYYPPTADLYNMDYSPIQTESKETVSNRSGNGNYEGDPMVYLVQKWLNQEYGDVSGFGSVTVNGKTGWETVHGLLRALQHELGITSLSNNFGPTTSSNYNQNILRRQDGVTNNMYAILQGALWCKGYNPGYNISESSDGTVNFNAVFDEDVENAVKALQLDAGLYPQDGVVSLNLMKALMSMDSFKLLPSAYGSDSNVRSFQQWLNRNFENYAGLSPCDGVYGRNTNKALIYAFQATEGLPLNIANGNFGNTTKLCCPQIPYFENSSAARCYPGSPDCDFYQYSKINTFTKILQFALYVNGFGSNNFDGIYSNETRQAVRECQEFYALPVTGVADKTTWLSLVISSGDKTRSAIAADCATILTAQKATALYNSGYRYIGRYLTGTYNGGISKALTRTEAEIILDAGLNFFPIYQTSARQCEYFTPEQGVLDAKEAINAAKNLGLPDNTIIYYAVDFDALDYQITSNILPYFEKVSEEMASCTYRTGVYGARNVCSRVSNQGYACSSFVGDMSTGFSGNLGFKMPDNWAFDQFSDKDADGNYIQINSSDGSFQIDKDGFSGRDQGVSSLLDENGQEFDANMFKQDSEESDTLVGPTINFMGQEIPLFQMNMTLSFDVLNVESIYDQDTGETKVLFGIKSVETETTIEGFREKAGKFNQAFDKAKTSIKLLGLNGKDFERTYNDFKGSLLDTNTKLAFGGDLKYYGYFVLNKNLDIIESGSAIIGEVKSSISYPLTTFVYLKFQLEGSINSSLTFKRTVEEGNGAFEKEGEVTFSVTPSIGVEANLFLASAYAGLRGSLDCDLLLPRQKYEDPFTVDFTASLFIEWNALNWGNSYQWDFSNVRLYPRDRANHLFVSNNDLKMIEPISTKSPSMRSNSNPNIFKSGVQIYSHPQIISIGNNKLLMTYVDDSLSRTAENRTILMYSVFDGNVWGTPQPVLDDNTADFDAKICSDGSGGAHIVWQNSNIVFNSNATLSQMSENIDLYYTHWNGVTFDNTVVLTNNNLDLEISPQIIATNNDISVIWKTNTENDSLTISGTNSILRKQFTNNSWQPIEQIATNLSLINSISSVYDNGINKIAYSTKSSNDSSIVSDLEVYYFDGLQTIQITSDSLPDYSVNMINNQICWLSAGKVFSVSFNDLNDKELLIDLSDYNVVNFNMEYAANNKALIWETEDNNGMMFFASYYDPVLNEFSTPQPISTDNGVVRGWDSCYNSSGEIELLFCYADLLSEPINNKNYGTLDLIQKKAESYVDLYVNPTLQFEGDIEPNGTLSLMPEIYNVGSAEINGVRIDVLDSNNNTIQTTTNNLTLESGEREILEVEFVLPQSLTRSDYTISVEPIGEEDKNNNNNTCELSVGFADLSIEMIDELRTNEGRKLRVKIKNNGYESVNNAKLDFISDSSSGVVLDSTENITLNIGDETYIYLLLDASYSNSAISEDPKIIYIKISSITSESNYNNNESIFYVFPDYQITVVPESTNGVVTGTGIYPKGGLVQLTATPNEGYAFDGWYENGLRILGAEESFTFCAHKNQAITARFVLLDYCEVELNNGSAGIIDDINKYLFGLNPGDQIEDSFYVTNNGFFKQLPSQSGFTNATGSEVHITSENGTVIDVYYIVILGDIDGDGAVDAFDLYNLNMYLNGYRQYSGAYLSACDLNQDGEITEIDYNICRNIIMGI